MNRLDWKCSNGDTLRDLNTRRGELEPLLSAARQKLREQEAKLRPLTKEVERISWEVSNICCRLNNWWRQYEGAKKSRHGESST